MKNTTYMIILLAALAIFLGMAPQASAGGHKKPGIILAFPPPPPIPPFIGVTIQPNSPPGDYTPPHGYRDDRRGHRDGHWEWTKVWIPGRDERVWIRGHYTRRGHWVPGHWERTHRPGYWENQRVWVPDHHRRAGYR